MSAVRKIDTKRIERMRQDWLNGMRQVDIAAKHGVSQGAVSKAIGGSPAQMANELRRVRDAVRAYFTNSGTQEDRDRLLWDAFFEATA